MHLPIHPSRARSTPPPATLSTDRRITLGGVAVAALFMALAGLSLALPERIRLGTWLPLHLLLAGSAATAIAAVLPFFTTTLAAARPAPAAVRVAAIVLVAGGAVGAITAFGHAAGSAVAAAAAGGAFLAGIGLVAVAAFAPVRRGLGVRRRPIEAAYAIALADVAVGATLALLFVGGQAEATARWLDLKPAHAWLNAFGFVGLTIAATLVHLAPTASGSRIVGRPSALAALAAVAAGPPLAAAGHVLGVDGVARLGGAIVAGGGLALAMHGWQVRRAAGRWTSELAWHDLASLSLLAGSAWFAVAAVVAGARLAVLGPEPATWSMPLIVAPFVIGFLGQVLVGAWTHLVPAIGPGGPARHARQRAILARWHRPRLAALNAGCAILWLGMVAGQPDAARAGLLMCIATLAVGVALLGRALRAGGETSVGGEISAGEISAAAPGR